MRERGDALPVHSTVQECLNNRQTSDQTEDDELTDDVAPGEPNYDRKTAEIKTVFTAEPLTMVTAAQLNELAAVQVPKWTTPDASR